MTKRLFAAIDIPESIQCLLGKLDPHIRGVRWTSPEQMHLTLGFFGNADMEKEASLRETLSVIKFGSFFLPIAGIGTFPSKRAPKVVWIGVGKGHPHLFQLHKRVQEAALAVAIEPDLRPWHPHITMARCVDVSWHSIKSFLLEHADFDAGTIRVTEFHVYSSQLTPAGPIHAREFSIQANERSASPE